MRQLVASSQVLEFSDLEKVLRDVSGLIGSKLKVQIFLLSPITDSQGSFTFLKNSALASGNAVFIYMPVPSSKPAI